ncbi:MAG TPA: S41 family peptidase [Candidatus Saccharimonadales bacterium]|jgi:carboxyl-terminal processing protease|nr:S41 family peptidase [Candidatus Saccharimonadales bacterium]
MEPKQTGGEYPKKRRWPRWIAKVIVVVAVFALGLFVGNGTISLHRQHGVAGKLPSKPDYSSVTQVYKSLIENYDGKLTENQILDGLKHGLAESTNDPYTEYFTPQEAKTFNQELNNQFSGIGAELGQDSDGNLQVIAPIAGTPAAKAGLQAGDLITSINGQSTSGMSIDAAVSKIRGKAGTTVKLQIVRAKIKALTLIITRDNITVPSVNSKILPGNIGYLQITSFSDDTAELAQKAAQQFKDKKVSGIVLDLRSDPGGLLDAAIKVSSLWLPKDKMILQEKRGSEVVQTYYSEGGDILNGIPTTVLIDNGSASASEITAGALHDNGVAYVIGEKSYGKGVVQQLIDFGDGSQLKVTVASWYRPDGKNINHRGITPDKTVKEPSGATAGGKNDVQLQAAESYLSSH